MLHVQRGAVPDVDDTAGASRSLAEQRADLVESADRLTGMAGVLSTEQWRAEVRTRQGTPIEATRIPWMRLQEVLIHHLDQVFQWQIDFSRQIQKGDRYRFAFERQVRPDGSMRAGHLIAAELVNAGVSLKRYERVEPTLHQIFVDHVGPAFPGHFRDPGDRGVGCGDITSRRNP